MLVRGCRLGPLAMGFLLVFFGSLVSCSSAAPTQSATAENASVPAPERDPAAVAIGTTIMEDPLLKKARTFELFLRNKLSDDEVAELLSQCNSEPAENLFCSSILNRDKLVEKTKASIARTAHPGKRKRSYLHIRFSRKKQLLNWQEVRTASLPTLLRAVHSLSPSELVELKRAAFRETECPNAPAIAVASALEDSLPDRANLDEIGRLYEKGADCLTDPADQEHLLTRGGLFYFANKDYRLASEILLRSSSIKDTFAARALYWLFRARMELGEKKKAQTVLEQLEQRYPFSFHTLIAVAGTNRDPGEILSKSASTGFKRRSDQLPALNQLIEQAEVLHRLRVDYAASKVLDWAIADSHGAEPQVMLYVAELKKEQGDYRSKISLLSDLLYKNPSLISKETMELYFPKVYFPIFERQSSGIDPYLLLAIARRESAFNVQARSSANARGLLQLIPSTARLFRKRPNLFDPEQNVEVGAKYVELLLRRTNGQIHLALAAYNAGPLKLTEWSNRYPLTEPMLFIDLIPYRETREYVASVLRNYYWYRRIHQTGDEKMTPRRMLELAITKGG